MRPTPASPPPHAQRLLEVLREPARCSTFDAPTWDRLLRSARAARLQGTLAARVSAALSIDRLDPIVRRQLLAGQVEAEFRAQKVRHLLSAIEPLIAASAVPCLLLKGSAYLTQGLALAEGRIPADVDVMVPRTAIDDIEQALRAAGWQYDEELTPYDHRYYRDWSHELPPLRSPGQALELDLHHTILPPLGRLKPETRALFDAASRMQGTPFSVLAPADQVLLAAAHLFHDSDCTNRLRDLVDVDGLLRAFSANDPEFWRTLDARAQRHHLGRPLWYALTFARAWLGTPVPDDALGRIEAYRPAGAVASVVVALIARTLPPVDPDGEATRLRSWASRLLLARATGQRMPPGLVAKHGLHKLTRAWPRELVVKAKTA
jgi:hypothetical protein